MWNSVYYSLGGENNFLKMRKIIFYNIDFIGKRNVETEKIYNNIKLQQFQYDFQ